MANHSVHIRVEPQAAQKEPGHGEGAVEPERLHIGAARGERDDAEPVVVGKESKDFATGGNRGVVGVVDVGEFVFHGCFAVRLSRRRCEGRSSRFFRPRSPGIYSGVILFLRLF